MAKTMMITFGTLGILAVAIVSIIFLWRYVKETMPFSSYTTSDVLVGTARVRAFLADTEEKRTHGLMEVTNLPQDKGMLFLFPDADVRTFWNKNTLIDLDILWIAGGKVVGISLLPAVTKSNGVAIISSREPVTMVLEVNAGWSKRNGVQQGDDIKIKE